MSDETKDPLVTARENVPRPDGLKRDARGFMRPPPLTKAQRIILQDKALELNLAGYSYGKIGTVLSAEAFQRSIGIDPVRVIPKVMAFRLVDKALEETREERNQKADQKRKRELFRLDAIFASNWAKRGEPRHAEVLLKVSTRRSKLEGLDAPQRVLHEGEVHTGGLPLSLLTDEELETYEKLSAAVATRVAVSRNVEAEEPGEPEDPDEGEGPDEDGGEP